MVSRRYGLYFAWLIAMVATFVSLYYSEVLHLPPCNLCWYQRMGFYPLALLLGVATYRRDKGLIPYAALLAGAGLFFALYHILEQHIPGFAGINLCGSGPDCASGGVTYFGFITIPLMSAIGFAAILYFLYSAKKSSS